MLEVRVRLGLVRAIEPTVTTAQQISRSPLGRRNLRASRRQLT